MSEPLATAGAPAELVRVEGLARRFETAGGPIHVLEDLDLQLAEGERVAIVGQSGVGKTTLLQILGTLDHPSAGRVWFRGVDVFDRPRAEIARLRNEFLGFVFQFHHLLPEFNALENVMMPGLIRGEPRERIRERGEAMLRDVGLAHRTTHPVGKLSGGERQRVAVARALVLEPPLLLADEPTGNLDPAIGDQIAELLLEVNAGRGTTLVVVTHSERLASRMDRRLELREGRLWAQPRGGPSS